MVAVLKHRRLRDFDWLVAALAIMIVCFGAWEIHNAQPTETFWQKQLIGLGVALVAMFAIAFTDYRRVMELAPVFYVFGLLLLVLVLVPIPGVSLKINGHRSWLRVPGLGTFQPSEFVKVTTAILLVVLFLSAIRMRTVVAALVLSIVIIPAGYWVGVKTHLVKNYQQERINVILDPENADKRGFGYHTWQSMVTVGSGSLMGSRDPEYSQSSLKFLPEPHSDFIFAVTAETTGFIGCLLLLASYALLLTRLIIDARRARDRTGMLVIMAIVGGLIFQIFINVGMAVGLLPVIGVPLPLMSAGLSSVLATFIAIGFAISVQLRRFVN